MLLKTRPKVWNRGLPADDVAAVTDFVVAEIESGGYDLVVFTTDFLEGGDCGVFALDSTPWSDPTKPVALVPYREYLTIDTNGEGCDIHSTIREAFPGLSSKRSSRTIETIKSKSTGKESDLLFLRKQVDDGELGKNRRHCMHRSTSPTHRPTTTPMHPVAP